MMNVMMNFNAQIGEKKVCSSNGTMKNMNVMMNFDNSISAYVCVVFTMKTHFHLNFNLRAETESCILLPLGAAGASKKSANRKEEYKQGH